MDRPLASDPRALLREYLTRVADHQTETLLALTYWTAIAAAKALTRVFGRRLLPNGRDRAASYWMDRSPDVHDERWFERQF